MTNTTQRSYKVGDFLTEHLVTDSIGYEVVGTTPQGIKVRRTAAGDVVATTEAAYPVVYTEIVSDPDGDTRLLRRRKDGAFRTWARGSALVPARMIDGKPVTRTDYSF